MLDPQPQTNILTDTVNVLQCDICLVYYFHLKNFFWLRRVQLQIGISAVKKESTMLNIHLASS